MPGRADEEPILPFPVARHLVAAATKFRSTWLSTSLRSLRERNLLDAYLGHLPREHHEAVVSSVPGVWLPIGVAIAHYEACDALRLDEKEIIAIGRETSDRAQRKSVTTATRLITPMLAAPVDVSPWPLLMQLHRQWERIWVGGAVGAFPVSPREARVEVVGWPCARIPYTRVAMRGVLLGMGTLFSRRVGIHEIEELMSGSTLGWRVEW